MLLFDEFGLITASNNLVARSLKPNELLSDTNRALEEWSRIFKVPHLEKKLSFLAQIWSVNLIFLATILFIVIIIIIITIITRPCAALRAADLDWIVSLTTIWVRCILKGNIIV